MRRMRLEILNSGKIRAVSYTSYRKSILETSRFYAEANNFGEKNIKHFS